MSDQLYKFIKKEVENHDYKMNIHHLETISNAIYSQLEEYLNPEVTKVLLSESSETFRKLIDNLIPLVEEYEQKVDSVLKEHMSRIFNC